MKAKTSPTKSKIVKPVTKTAKTASAKPGDEYRNYLKGYGYNDAQIDEHFRQLGERSVAAQRSKFETVDPIDRSPVQDLLFVERRAAAIEGRPTDAVTEENVRQIAKARRDKSSFTSMPTATKAQVSKIVTPVANSVAVEVTQSASGRFCIFGNPHTKVFLWMGNQGWTTEQVQTCIKSIGMPEISLNSINTFLRAGRKPDNDKRGPSATITESQAKALNVAGGIKPVEPKPESKKSAIKKSK